LYEREYFMKFLLASRLKTRGVVEDELWVALEGKLNTDIMDSPLRDESQ